MAIDDCHKTFQAVIRHDVHVAIVSSIAKVASQLPTERKREKMAARLQHHYLSIKSVGFYMHNREFLYANAVALVKLVDEWRYPADAPAVMGALMLKEDAETDEAGDWNLSRSHALKMSEVAYDGYCRTELYRYPDAEVG